jgi:hypothetical protein
VAWPSAAERRSCSAYWYAVLVMALHRYQEPEQRGVTNSIACLQCWYHDAWAGMERILLKAFPYKVFDWVDRSRELDVIW